MTFFKLGRKKQVSLNSGRELKVLHELQIINETFFRRVSLRQKQEQYSCREDSKTEAGAILRWDDKATAGQAKISSPSTLLHFIARHISQSLHHHHQTDLSTVQQP